MDPLNPYLLLTPGPLSTTGSVKEKMLRDWCTWDDDYNNIVQSVREELTELSSENPELFTCTLMQGSGTFSVEATVGSVVPPDGKLLILANGAYGLRIQSIATYLNISNTTLNFGDQGVIDLGELERTLKDDDEITTIIVVHCETTTGMLNPIHEIGLICQKFNKCYIVDAMSSFGGIPIDMETSGIDYLVSSANKCIQGVPGFGLIIARKDEISKIKGFARSLSLDLYDQWSTMENQNGKWRFTSPTHVVRAFKQALSELKHEGGIAVRYTRYLNNQKKLVTGMEALGFQTLLPESNHSPIITTFLSPSHPDFDFKRFYLELKEKGFVIYPGKVTDHDCFRIGNIGDVHEEDIKNLLEALKNSVYWS